MEIEDAKKFAMRFAKESREFGLRIEPPAEKRRLYAKYVRPQNERGTINMAKVNDKLTVTIEAEGLREVVRQEVNARVRAAAKELSAQMKAARDNSGELQRSTYYVIAVSEEGGDFEKVSVVHGSPEDVVKMSERLKAEGYPIRIVTEQLARADDFAERILTSDDISYILRSKAQKQPLAYVSTLALVEELAKRDGVNMRRIYAETDFGRVEKDEITVQRMFNRK